MIDKGQANKIKNRIVGHLNHQLDEIWRAHREIPDSCYDEWSKGYVFGLINSFGVDRWYMEDTKSGAIKRLKVYLDIYDRVFGKEHNSREMYAGIDEIRISALTEPNSAYMRGYNTGIIEGYRLEITRNRYQGWSGYVNTTEEQQRLEWENNKKEKDPSKYDKRSDKKTIGAQ